MAFEDMGKEVAFEDEALEWDSTIEKESGGPFRLLPEGEYDFTVERFDRIRYNGSEKIPPCWEADLNISVHDKDGDVEVKDRLFLTRKAEWKLSQFFIAIGQKKKGEPLKMNWNMVPGAKGRLTIKHRKGTGQYADKEFNQIDKYLEPAEAAAPAAKSKYTAGKF